MWLPDRDKLVKVRLKNGNDDVETPWAENLGEDKEGRGILVKVGKHSILPREAHLRRRSAAEPRPGRRGFLTWDSEGVPWEAILTRIHGDSGRWAMVLDWRPTDPKESAQAAFSRLDRAPELLQVAAEGRWAPGPDKLGRAYFAVPKGLTVTEVLSRLRSTVSGVELTLVHPT